MYFKLKAPIRINTFSKVFDVRATNNYPVLALCTDFNSYVIKHTKSKTPCSRLATELIASYFLKVWNIKTPDIAIIDVKPEHLSDVITTTVQPAYFNLPCFGSQFDKYAKEFTNFMGKITQYEKQKFSNRNDFLKLAFFDIWMANEDRTYNNPNFLITSEKTGYQVFAIDHESCFNSSNLERGLYELNFEDSILTHPSIKHIMGRDMSDQENLEKLIKDAYLCIDACKQHIDEILSYIPAEWQINTVLYKQLLVDTVFNISWIDSSKKIFFEFLQKANNP
jgi:hypothetical protein